MGIEYSDNTMHLDCDHCNRKPEIYFGSWREALDDAKRDGWEVYKDKAGTLGDAWCHKCPDCVKDIIKKRIIP